jgi:hypothetical protein
MGGMEDDDDNDGLDRDGQDGQGNGEEEKEDWNNFRTGGPIQLEGEDGKIVKNNSGKAIKMRK